ncbi:MAG: isocitrate lyase/phosphoenolpyruvate mutase family protein [Solirubrobacterales bacterium]
MPLTQREKGETLKALHEGEPFVIPNPWDAGTARLLAGLGYKALATTSAGLCFRLGRPSKILTLDEVTAHIAELDQATDLPVSADLENGYGAEPEDAARAIILAAEAGAVGGSIEDWDPSGHIYERDFAVERVAAAVEAARSLDFPFALVGRAENHFRGNPDLDDTIARLQAYEEAGADVLYAPGIRKFEEIRAVCGAVSRPVNVFSMGLSFQEIVDAGAQRVSTAGGLTYAAANAVIEAAVKIRDEGDFTGLGRPDRVTELGA